MDFMSAAWWAFGSLVFGLGLGYYVGWSRAKHPGKIEQQIQDIKEKL